MARLDPTKRASLPDSAFAYVDSRGRRRLPINDESHVRNALSRFNQVAFENDEARERARKRLLKAAKKYGIMPIGFITGELAAERKAAAAGRLVIELGRVGAPGDLEERLRTVLRDQTLAVLYWSQTSGTYLDGTGRPVALPAEDDEACVTYLERNGQPMTAVVHHRAALDDPALKENVMAAVRFVLEKERDYGQVQAAPTDATALPTGFLTMLMTDIESSTDLVQRLGDDYAVLLAEVRAIVRTAILRAHGREIEVRADEFFAIFENAIEAVSAAAAIQRAFAERASSTDFGVRVRVGIHSGCPTLTDVGYIGIAVHTAARVSSAAHGGQILLSGETMRAIGDSYPAGIGFRSLGRHQLHGLPAEEELFQAEGAGLLASFPPPRTTAPLSSDPWE